MISHDKNILVKTMRYVFFFIYSHLLSFFGIFLKLEHIIIFFNAEYAFTSN